ncbi:MAG: sulfatase-like hydrolase/transferase [Acidobacteriota bacterium]
MRTTRREWLAGNVAVAGLRAAQPHRPNILWISCEDTSPVLGCYGDRHGITPTLDRLAAQGVRYTNAYTVAGVCAPSRSGIITGMYPTTLGTHHMRCQAKLPPHVRCFPEYLREAGYYCANNVKTDYNFPPPKAAWDESSQKAHWRNRPAGRPFFAVFNFTTTHESQIRATDEQYARITARLRPDERQDPGGLAIPPYHPDTPAVRRDWARFYELVTAMDYQAAGVLSQLEQDGLAEGTIVFYWGDHGVGLPRAKRWLYDSGTRVPLIIRIPEKFRAGNQGKPGSVSDELVSFIDLAPTVLNLAGVKIPAHMQGRAFLGSNPTPPRQYVYGVRDRMDERYDTVRSVRDKRYRYIRNYVSFKPYYQHMNTPEGGPTMRELRRLHALGKLTPAAAQFMADRKPIEELYDLESDPHEVRNLAASAEHREALERLRAAHLKWMLDTRDLGLVPEPEIAEREEKYGSRYEILRQPGAEKLIPRLRAVVEMGERGDLPGLLGALKANDAGVRYWAATGLGNLGSGAGTAVEPLRAALKDGSASVRIAAARALRRDGEALAVLVREVKSEREWVRLSAAIVLDEMGEQARPARQALEEVLADTRDQHRYAVRVANHALKRLL